MLCAWGTRVFPQQAEQTQLTPTGNVHGVVVDREGKVCEGARVALSVSTTQKQSAVSDDQGHYTFSNVPAGAFTITVSSSGFATQVVSGIVHPGESVELQPVTMRITDSTQQVQVTADIHDIAQAQIDLEEQQRVLAIVPNFYVSYAKSPAPLTTRQKFRLAWRSSIDPFTFIASGIAAGIEQADNDEQSWGQGASGYSKRYAAAYGDNIVGTMLSSAVFPSLLHQDPRYFYKGTGTKMSRILYAIRSSVFCHGDNGRWQFDYSSLLGDLSSAGLSNVYYPADERNGIGLTVRNLAIDKVTGAAQNILQEFVIRKLTPKANHQP